MATPTSVTFTNKIASVGAPTSSTGIFAAADANELKTACNETITYLTDDRVEIGSGADGSTTRNNVAIGKNATTSETGISSVAIGESATATLPRSVAIGLNSTAVLDNTYGGADGDEAIAIGEGATAYAWRAVAVGGDAHAAATSSTAVGAGSVCSNTHGVSIGRGSWCPGSSEKTVSPQPKVVLGGAVFGQDINVYFCTTWANNFDTPISGIGVGSEATPSNYEIVLHGIDAWDSRTSPSETNTAAGHLALCGGISTGTGLGGEVRFSTVPAGGVSNNTKNSKVLAGKFDSAAGVDTRFLLLDVTDSTVKRVTFGADDSGGSGFKLLRVAN